MTIDEKARLLDGIQHLGLIGWYLLTTAASIIIIYFAATNDRDN